MGLCIKTVYIFFGALCGVMAVLLALCFVFDIYPSAYSMSADGQLCGSIYAAGALIAIGLYKIESLRGEVDKLKGRIDSEI